MRCVVIIMAMQGANLARSIGEVVTTTAFQTRLTTDILVMSDGSQAVDPVVQMACALSPDRSIHVLRQQGCGRIHALTTGLRLAHAAGYAVAVISHGTHEQDHTRIPRLEAAVVTRIERGDHAIVIAPRRYRPAQSWFDRVRERHVRMRTIDPCAGLYAVSLVSSSTGTTLTIPPIPEQRTTDLHPLRALILANPDIPIKDISDQGTRTIPNPAGRGLCARLAQYMPPWG